MYENSHEDELLTDLRKVVRSTGRSYQSIAHFMQVMNALRELISHLRLGNGDEDKLIRLLGGKVEVGGQKRLKKSFLYIVSKARHLSCRTHLHT